MVTTKTHNKETAVESCKYSVFNSVLLVILIAMSAFQMYFLTQIFSPQEGITLFVPRSINTQKTPDTPVSRDDILREALLQIEYDKVGGKENYEVIAEINRLTLTDERNPQNINAMREYLKKLQDGSALTDDTLVGDGSQPAPQDMADGALADVLKNAVVEGNPEAEVIAVEYSDMECPYCIRHHNETDLKKSLQEKYGDRVAFVFKNHRGVNHAGTEVKALGALCANKLGGAEAYAKFYSTILNGSTMSSLYSVGELKNLAVSIGLDADAWQACVDSKELLDQFNAETREAQKYGLSGTPGILLMNVKTGKYDTVEGAYPKQVFMDKVQGLLKKAE